MSAKVGSVKVAVTVGAALIVTVQVPVPVQAPLQPVKVEPAAGAAVRVTTVPLVNDAEHVDAAGDAGRRAGDGAAAGAGLGHGEREARA